MRLAELLDKKKVIQDDTIVAIGTKNGSSYMYIGRADDRELMDKCFEKYLRKMKAKLKRDEAELRKVMTNMSSKTFDDTTDIRGVIGEAELIGRAYRRYFETKDYIDSYQPVLDRYVVERYAKDFGNELAIIVGGREDGEFWTKEEFDRKYSKKN